MVRDNWIYKKPNSLVVKTIAILVWWLYIAAIIQEIVNAGG